MQSSCEDMFELAYATEAEAFSDDEHDPFMDFPPECVPPERQSISAMDAAGPSRRTTRAAARRHRQRELEDLETARKQPSSRLAPINNGREIERPPREQRRGVMYRTTARAIDAKPPRSPFLKGTRPGWEPMIQRDPLKIKANPRIEEAALNSLQRQGCQDPVQHYFPEHECNVHQRRLECLRQIANWTRNRHIVEEIATKLPKELAIQVFEYVVLSSQSHIAFQDEWMLEVTTREIIGASISAEALLPLAAEGILKQSIFDIDVEYRRTDGQHVVVLPPDLLRVPHPLRKARITLNFEIPIGRQKYPAPLYIAAAGMPSLISQLPGLQDLHILLCINLTRPPWEHQGSALEVSCRKGFSGVSTFRKALEGLVEAAKITRPSLEVHVELQYIYEGTWRGAYQAPPETYNVAQGTMTAEELIKAADAKWQQCRTSQG